MKVTWGWHDGYVNNRRDCEVEIPDEDLEGLEGDEQDRYIDEFIREEFNNRVTYYWKVIRK